jgi:hypothetical protein
MMFERMRHGVGKHVLSDNGFRKHVRSDDDIGESVLIDGDFITHGQTLSGRWQEHVNRHSTVRAQR